MNTLTLTEFDKLKTIPAIRTALFGDETETETTEYIAEEGKGPVRQVTVTRNVLSGEIVETVITEWTYFDDDAVKDIATTKRDGADKIISAQVVKHDHDKHDPVMEV